MVLLSLCAFFGILLVGATSLFMMNEVRIGGAAYRYIQKDKDALESIALLKADLFQINSEMQSLLRNAEHVDTGKSIASIKNISNNIELNFGILLESVSSQGKLEGINRALAIWNEYRKTLFVEVLPAVASGNVVKAGALMSGIQAERFSTFSKTIVQMVDGIREDVSATERQIAASIKIKIAISAVSMIAVICLIGLFSYFITTSVTSPLKNCVDFAKALAGGRLDARLEVRGGGETAQLAYAMNTMAENLHSMVSRIGSASEVLTSIDTNLEETARQVVASAQKQEKSVVVTSQAVVQITDSVHEVYEGIDKLSESATGTSSSTLEMAATTEEIAISAEKLAEAVEEVSDSISHMAASIKEIDVNITNLLDSSTVTASSIAEMDATIKQVEKNAMDAAEISATVRNDAETGKIAVLEAIAGMQAIRSSSQITSEAIETLSVRVKDIGAILSVIDEVAEQTNLLAFNAAIIAAQAGDHGKGFAVVAEEIRELAERTRCSTREIAAVITGVQEETRRAVEAISQAEVSIVAGEMLSQRSGAALEKIVTGVQQTGIQVSSIARATVEQARGSQSIRDAMERIEVMVENIVHSTRKHSYGTDLISAAAERMKELTMGVRVSTREQNRASNLIARSAEDVTTMADQIREECRSQIDSSNLISKSVSTIEGAAAANSLATQVMNIAVADLSRQIELLKKEMAGFRI
jgi:methyl-accepting chemotaxis protein